MANTTFSFRLSAVCLGLAASLCAQTAPAPSAADAAPAGIGLIELFVYMVNLIFGHSDTGIRYFDLKVNAV